jgi:hypothetical protein
MIYLNHRIFSAPHPGAAGLSNHPLVTWAWVLAMASLILLGFGSHPGTAPAEASSAGGNAALTHEQQRLQGFVDALLGEGAIRDMAACHARDVCVQVTALFRGLRPGDKRSIARGISRYFETRPGYAIPVRHVRFLDADSGLELGRYGLGRLEWGGRL